MSRSGRRWVWASAVISGILLATLGRPAAHLTLAVLRDRQDRPAPPPGYLDDASALQQTGIRELWDVPSDPAAAEKQLSALVQRAHAQGIGISIAGARHSMGGQSILRDGIVINMLPLRAMQLDAARNILRVQAGALWSQVLPYLNASGRSVAVMQSNNSFSVGGSLSVNCHGWQANRPPIASTVQAFRILLADGSIVRCSRTENSELFSLALGGYGLFGLILDMDLKVVPNEEYRLERFVMPVDEFTTAYESHVRHRTEVGMAYGRLSVAPESFLGEAILNVFHTVPGGSGKPSRVDFPEITSLTRAMFRGQVGSEYGKSLRWRAEKGLAGALAQAPVYRNQLLGEPVDVFANRSAASTDILHEYFVPPEHFQALVQQLRVLIPAHKGDLLNVTVRHVLGDDDTFLRYADRDMFALVMLFNQPRTPDGDAAMERMTRALIDATVHLGGRYYLPYRLHATREQVQAAYPQSSRFFELKRHYDPQELFQNFLYAEYGRTGR